MYFGDLDYLSDRLGHFNIDISSGLALLALLWLDRLGNGDGRSLFFNVHKVGSLFTRRFPGWLGFNGRDIVRLSGLLRLWRRL